jgi:hypothetical protein
MHARWHVAERRNFADPVEILAHRLRRLRYRDGRHGCLRNLQRTRQSAAFDAASQYRRRIGGTRTLDRRPCPPVRRRLLTV